MSEIADIPDWLRAKTGEQITQQFRHWIDNTKTKLLRASPKGEQALCRILDKLKSRLPSRYHSLLHYTRQKWYIVAPGVVFFGDFYFAGMRLLIEVDGPSHAGTLAREKDAWRTKLISLWKVRVARIANSTLLDTDFRQIERWFINQCVKALPRDRGRLLWNTYRQMMRANPNIYTMPGTLTTYKNTDA